MQGFNMGRYVPPDLEGTTSGNKLHARPPPGRSLSKPGVQMVRFEMPYAIWCLSCPRPTLIGQGVRFNAEKRRAGAYHSTPIWSFRMRHADCGGALEIRTDPQNTAYVVVSGARRRDTAEGDEGLARARGQEVILSDAEREALRSNAFASLERTIEDREALRVATDRIDELEDVSKRHWDDPGARNSELRKAFRVGRKERDAQAVVDDILQDTMGLGFELLPAVEEDARRAALVDFGSAEVADAALKKPLFPASNERKKPVVDQKRSSGKPMLPPGTPKAEVLAAKRREGFVSEVVGNTRLVKDPFMLDVKLEHKLAGPARIPGVKRKRQEETAQEEKRAPPRPSLSTALVAYGSDSE
ncbi:CWC16 protein [Plectosphaerella plurivora]|uniref:CWC16 protein n=1 Tax=Plectosphaerella plurivora TaxID=936078 RepID=A0A9P8VHZ6_9PEZI|nr:CWC16 protein [Plectosphaerella plurivora]